MNRKLLKSKKLCTKTRQKLNLRKICSVDNWSRDGSNEMSTENSKTFPVVLTKITETQKSFEHRINSLTEKISQPQQGTSNQNISHNFNNQQKWRGNSRGLINKIERTEDLILIKDRIISITKTKIKEDTGTILEGTLEEEITIEEIIKEETIVENVKILTTDIIVFCNMITKKLKRQ